LDFLAFVFFVPFVAKKFCAFGGLTCGRKKAQKHKIEFAFRGQALLLPPSVARRLNSKLWISFSCVFVPFVAKKFCAFGGLTCGRKKAQKHKIEFAFRGQALCSRQA
jgi:hypothetical protein